MNLKMMQFNIKPYLQMKMLALFAWAFACGLPLMLTTGTLSAYLMKLNISLKWIGLFSLATLPYSLKFLFAPLLQYIKNVRIKIIAGMFGVMLGFIWMGCLVITDIDHVWLLFLAVGFTVLCSSIVDIAEAEYRIELLDPQELSHGMACYNVGYRLGLMTGGGFAFFIAANYGWHFSYYVMSFLMLIGIAAVIYQPAAKSAFKPTSQNLLHLYIEPIRQWLLTPEWLTVIILILFYNYADNLFAMLLNPFLLHLGFNLSEIGFWQGSINCLMMMFGSLVAGILIAKYGTKKILFVCAALLALINLVFIPLAFFAIPGSLTTLMRELFYIHSVLGGFFLGISVTAYITFIASHCHAPYTASQNAFLTSLMALGKIFIITIGGYLAAYIGWKEFFVFIPVVTIPLMLLIYFYKNQPFLATESNLVKMTGI